MRFEEFAINHGLILKNLVTDRWVATPTTDHPRKTNGRYKFLGSIGWVQNWSTMDRPAQWIEEGKNASSPAIIKRIADSESDRKIRAEQASKKAGWILKQSEKKNHPYLASKGFTDQLGHVWNDQLVIPMRIDTRLVGCQLIDDKGIKKFLKGQTTKGATLTIDAKGFPIFCEGYATGLSIREVLKASNIKYVIHICFSASNMQFIARKFPYGLIVADNDNSHVGEVTARKTGKPYWISSAIGEDFNDFHKRVGTFQASQALKKKLIEIGSLVI
jgi:putative DNA primase/helicase